MRRLAVLVCVVVGCATKLPRAPNGPDPSPGRVPLRTAPPELYRTIHHALAVGEDFLVVGQQRPPGSPASSAFVGLANRDGDLRWAWEGKGAWEAAHRVAIGELGTAVVAGRSQADNGEMLWLRAFDREGEELWKTDLEDAAILGVGVWGNAAALLTAPYGTLDARVVEVDVATGAVKLAQLLEHAQWDERFEEVWPSAKKGFIVDGDVAVYPTEHDPKEWSRDYVELDEEEQSPATVEHPEPLEVIAKTPGELRTEAQVVAELRWSMEAGVEWDWPHNDAATLIALRHLNRTGCEDVVKEEACSEESTTEAPSYDEYAYSDPCHVQMYDALLASASDAVSKALAGDFVELVSELPEGHPLIDVVFTHAKSVGSLAVMESAVWEPRLHDRILELAVSDLGAAQSLERGLREGSQECELVAKLRALANAKGVAVPAFPNAFDDACDQLYAMCVEGASDDTVLPASGQFKAITTCEDEYPTDGTVEECEPSHEWSDDVPDVTSPGALGRCAGSSITSEPYSPVGNCGVPDEYLLETIDFKQAKGGRWVIETVETQWQVK